MQSIERYGLVALLFLVVTIIAVLIWDEDVMAKPDTSARAEPAGTAVAPAATRRAKPVENAGPQPEAGGAEHVQLRVAPKARGVNRRDLEQRRREEAERARASSSVLAGDVRGAQPQAGIVSAGATSAVGSATTGRRSSGGDPARERRARAQEAPPERSEAVQARRPRAGPDPARAAGGTYRVRAGDTLGEIAQRELGTFRRWREIVELNPDLNPDRIVVGQELLLPAGAAPSTSVEPRVVSRSPTPKATGASQGSEAYRVREGDSLWKIAQRALGDGERWSDIAALNPKIDPDRLRVGQELVLPARAQRDPVPRPGQLVASSSAPAGDGAPRRGGRVR